MTVVSVLLAVHHNGQFADVHFKVAASLAGAVLLTQRTKHWRHFEVRRFAFLPSSAHTGLSLVRFAHVYMLLYTVSTTCKVP